MLKFRGPAKAGDSGGVEVEMVDVGLASIACSCLLEDKTNGLEKV